MKLKKNTFTFKLIHKNSKPETNLVQVSHDVPDILADWNSKIEAYRPALCQSSLISTGAGSFMRRQSYVNWPCGSYMREMLVCVNRSCCSYVGHWSVLIDHAAVIWYAGLVLTDHAARIRDAGLDVNGSCRSSASRWSYLQANFIIAVANMF